MPAKTSAPHTPETLREICTRILQTSDRLEWVAKEMERLKIESLEVKEHKNLFRGMKAVEGFCEQAVIALKKAREEMGHYGPYMPDEPPKRNGRTPKKKS